MDERWELAVADGAFWIDDGPSKLDLLITDGVECGNIYVTPVEACRIALELLRRVLVLVREKGGRLINIDASLIAEAPKVGPYVPAMRERLGAALGLPPARVGVKATTNERMGFVGRGEGIAALAVATVLMPDTPAAS